MKSVLWEIPPRGDWRHDFSAVPIVEKTGGRIAVLVVYPVGRSHTYVLPEARAIVAAHNAPIKAKARARAKKARNAKTKSPPFCY